MASSRFALSKSFSAISRTKSSSEIFGDQFSLFFALVGSERRFSTSDALKYIGSTSIIVAPDAVLVAFSLTPEPSNSIFIPHRSTLSSLS